jgi:hypothetical protein
MRRDHAWKPPRGEKDDMRRQARAHSTDGNSRPRPIATGDLLESNQ